MSTEATPYANLSPDLILSAIENVGFRCSGSLLALNSYENRVYQVGIENDKPMIAKFYRPHRWSSEAILEEHQFANELISHDIPIVAPWKNKSGKTLHEFEHYRFALFPRWGGRALDLNDLEKLEWIGRLVGRIHAIGSTHPFKHRPAINVQTHGYYAYHYLIKTDFIPTYLKRDYCQITETLLQKIDSQFKNTNPKYLRVHGDIHAGNILWDNLGPHIVDLDDAVMGPAVQDIWMLLSGDLEESSFQLELILKGYQQFYDFDLQSLTLIESLRSLRQIQYSAWLANRWEDPAFPKAFPWFNTPRYWEEQLADLNKQLRVV